MGSQGQAPYRKTLAIRAATPILSAVAKGRLRNHCLALNRSIEEPLEVVACWRSRGSGVLPSELYRGTQRTAREASGGSLHPAEGSFLQLTFELRGACGGSLADERLAEVGRGLSVKPLSLLEQLRGLWSIPAAHSDDEPWPVLAPDALQEGLAGGVRRAPRKGQL